MKRPILALLFLLGVLFITSCRATPREVEQSDSEEVQTEALSYLPTEEETGL